MDYYNKSSLIKKLLYQSKNRGCKETGLILSNFAEKFIFQMDEEGLMNFTIILMQNDLDIYDWVTAKVIPPKELNSTIMSQLISFSLYN